MTDAALKKLAHELAKDVDLLKGFPSLHADMACPSKRDKYYAAKKEIYQGLKQANDEFFKVLEAKIQKAEKEFAPPTVTSALLETLKSYVDSICMDAGRIGAVAELLNEKAIANG